MKAQAQSVLDGVRVASPCNARWEDMEGDERKRFCGQCQKNVFNFSAMTRAEVESLLQQKDNRICGRFYRRVDGRLLTTDCPVGLRRKRNRLARWGSAVIAMMAFFLGGCSARRQSPLMGEVCVSDPAQTNPPLMGKIAVPLTNNPPTGGKK